VLKRRLVDVLKRSNEKQRKSNGSIVVSSDEFFSK
jgi:hypothetical protein